MESNLNTKDFFYKGENYLFKEYNFPTNDYNSIYICPYVINNNSKFPFLRFLLIKQMFDLDFLEIPIFGNLNSEELLGYSKTFLFNLLILNENKICLNDFEFKGYYEFNNNLYLFIDITKCELIIKDIYISNNLWLALIDEILNTKHLCNIPINNSISNFFINNDFFCFLLNNKNESFEIPITGYVDKEENKLNFTYIFGESRSEMNSMFGPYYYFTNFNESFKNSYNNYVKREKQDKQDKQDKQEKKNNYSKYGLVRFALFTGLTKYIENHFNDKMDESFIKQERLNNLNLDQNLEILTSRISDYDGLWAKEKYNSVYLGNIELDNGVYLNKSLIVLKEYEQQCPLSYHYINKKLYSENNVINIL